MNGVQTVANALNKDSKLQVCTYVLGLQKLQKASTIAMIAVQRTLNAAMLKPTLLDYIVARYRMR
jgi:hypothetical protein